MNGKGELWLNVEGVQNNDFLLNIRSIFSSLNHSVFGELGLSEDDDLWDKSETNRCFPGDSGLISLYAQSRIARFSKKFTCD